MVNSEEVYDKNSTVKRRRKFDFASSFILAGAIGFMAFIFAPIQFYVGNQDEFWFTFLQLLSVGAIGFVFCLVVLGGILLLLSKTPLAKIIFSVVLCAFVYFYIQGNFVPRNYGVMDGKTIDWNSYHGYAITSIVLIAVFATIALALILFAKEKVLKIAKVISMMLTAIMLISTTTLLIQNKDVFTVEKDLVCTDEGLYEFSENQNVIVIILDTFDSNYFDKILELNGSEVTDTLKDFTYYRNTVGSYPTTKGALPYIVTGLWNENEVPWKEYLSDAYGESEFLNFLEDNDYEIGLYTEQPFANEDYRDFSNIMNKKTVVDNKFGFLTKMLELVSFNYMPHQLKQYFYITGDAFDSFYALDDSTSVYDYHIVSNYAELCDIEFSVTDSNSVFKIIHFDGTHAPATFNAELEECEGVTVNDEAMGNITYLNKYFDMLKEYDLYEKTPIIVMADHGCGYGISQSPLFMIKNIGEEHGTLQISDVAMSHEYLSDIFISLASGETVDEDFIEAYDGATNGRRFLNYSWDDSWKADYLPSITEYTFYTSNSIEDAEVSFTYDYLVGNGYEYLLGDELTFGKNGNSDVYRYLGFSGNEPEYTWTSGYKSGIVLVPDDNCNSNLLLTMNFGTLSTQTVSIYCNYNFVTEFTADGTKERQIVIPSEYYTNEGYINLTFVLRTAITPEELGISGDKRILALSFRSITLTETDLEYTGEVVEIEQ